MTGTLNTSSTDDILTEIDNTNNKIKVTVSSGAYLEATDKEVDVTSVYQKGYSDGLAKKVNGKITYTYHQHKDAAGNSISDTATSSTKGGCLTTENIVYTTTRGTCGGWIGYSHSNSIYDDEHGRWVNWQFYRCSRCGATYPQDRLPPNSTCWQTVNKQVDSGKRYYSLGCGKTTSTIESAYIVYD